MAGTMRTQKEPGLIGMSDQPITGQAGEEDSLREAMLPPKLRDWRAKLGAKAKKEKRFRFYSLYGLVSHPREPRSRPLHGDRRRHGGLLRQHPA
jgi:hypothetical protein